MIGLGWVKVEVFGGFEVGCVAVYVREFGCGGVWRRESGCVGGWVEERACWVGVSGG